MIYYRRPSTLAHIDTPEEILGFQDLSGTELSICHTFGDFHVVGICDPLLWRTPGDDAQWVDGPDGWQVTMDERSPLPGLCLRARPWCKVILVEAADGHPWAAPSILTAAAARAFPVRYVGKEFLPTPTPQQANAIAIASEARTLFQTAESIDSNILMPWAAWLLTLTTHISIDTIAALGLLDEHLAMQVIRAAAGLIAIDSNEHG